MTYCKNIELTFLDPIETKKYKLGIIDYSAAVVFVYHKRNFVKYHKGTISEEGKPISRKKFNKILIKSIKS